MNLRNKPRNKRRGAALVETAICMPVLVLLTWGTIDISSSLFLKQTLTSAAHEGALTGMRLNATETDIRERIAVVLESRDLADCSVEITPSGAAFDAMASGDMFSINISKSKQNSFINLSSISVNLSTKRP